MSFLKEDFATRQGLMNPDCEQTRLEKLARHKHCLDGISPDRFAAECYLLSQSPDIEIRKRLACFSTLHHAPQAMDILIHDPDPKVSVILARNPALFRADGAVEKMAKHPKSVVAATLALNSEMTLDHPATDILFQRCCAVDVYQYFLGRYSAEQVQEKIDGYNLPESSLLLLELRANGSHDPNRLSLSFL